MTKSLSNEELICKTAYRPSDMLVTLQYSFSLVFGHKTYVRLPNKYYFTYNMYISPIETPKFNNLDIKITYEDYSLKNIFDPKSVTCGMVRKQFCKSTLQIRTQFSELQRKLHR